MTLPITCGGAPVESLSIHVPGIGPWFAEVSFADDALEVPQGRVEVLAGSTRFRGTVPPAHDGTFALRRRFEVFAGGGGWGRLVKARSYGRNDAGVKASRVIADVALEVGETLGTVAPAAPTLGTHYASDAGMAARVLEDAARGVPWWVDYDGITHVTPRASDTPDAKAYQVLQCWPDLNYVQLGVEDLSTIHVGSILTERLPAPLVVKAIEFRVTPNEIRALCWTFADGQQSKLADALKNIARRATDGRLLGTYRYRVGEQHGEHVDLQLVKRRTGVPDLTRVSVWLGLPGASAKLTKSAEVLVQFIDGDRSDPAVTGFVGRGGAGYAPEHVTLGGAASDAETDEVAFKGCTVKMLTPPAVFTGTINGAPATGAVVWPTAFTTGTIEVGTPYVKVKRP